MRRQSKQRDGYVLVLTLAVIALAAISLAGLARYSLSLAVTANETALELQEVWGQYSVRHVLEVKAEAILDAQTPLAELHTPPWPKQARASVSFPLGRLHFRVQVADEDAKANLNTIQRRKPHEVLMAIRRLAGEKAPSVQLVPQAKGLPAFASWGQVFDLARMDTRATAQQLLATTSELTCWGGEPLNLRRASDAVIREVVGLVLPAHKVEELVTLRTHWGGQSVEELLAQLELRRTQLLAVRRLITNESRCYSLWIEIDNGQRSSTSLIVLDSQPVCFAW